MSVHPTAMIDPGAWIGSGASIGSGARIGSGATIGSGAWIGSDTTIGSDATIGSGAWIGSNVQIESGARIESGAVIESSRDVAHIQRAGSGQSLTLHCIRGGWALNAGCITFAGSSVMDVCTQAAHNIARHPEEWDDVEGTPEWDERAADVIAALVTLAATMGPTR